MRRFLIGLFILAPFLVHGQVISRTELRNTNNLIRAQTIASIDGLGSNVWLTGGTYASNITGRSFIAQGVGAVSPSSFSFDTTFFDIRHSGTTSILNSASTGVGVVAPISIRTAGLEAIHVAIDQKVGIGTNAPQGPLHVAGDGTAGVPQIKVDALGANSQGLFTIAGRAAGAEKKWTLASRGGLDAPNNRLAFLDQGNTERFTVLEDGKVGIGTINPLASVGISNSVAAQSALRIDTIGTNFAMIVFNGNTQILSLTTNGVLKIGGGTIPGELRMQDDQGNEQRIARVFNRDIHFGNTSSVDNVYIYAKELLNDNPIPVAFDGHTLFGPRLLSYNAALQNLTGYAENLFQIRNTNGATFLLVNSNGALTGTSAAFSSTVSGTAFTGSSFISTGSIPGQVQFVGTNNNGRVHATIAPDATSTNEFRFDWGTGAIAGQSAFALHSISALGPTNIYVLTNEVPILFAAASVITADRRFGRMWIQTNRMTGNQTLPLTNWGVGQLGTVAVPGEASGGTDRNLVVAVLAGDLIRLNGAAPVASLTLVVTNGIEWELSVLKKSFRSTNYWDIKTTFNVQ